MNILLSANKEFLKYVENLIATIKINNKKEELDIYFLYMEDINRELEELEKKLDNKYNAKLHCYKIDNNCIEGVPVANKIDNKFFGKEAYLRIIAPYILPKNLDRILYMDIDMVCDGSLKELYNIEFNDAAIIGCVDKGITDRHKIDLGLNKNVEYINSGMLLMNLEKIRSLYTIEEVKEYIHQKKDLLIYPDQDIINMLYNNHIKTVSSKYNYLIIYKDRENEKKVIYHYIGQQKPWDSKEAFKIRVKYMLLFYKYLILQHKYLTFFTNFCIYMLKKLLYIAYRIAAKMCPKMLKGYIINKNYIKEYKRYLHIHKCKKANEKITVVFVLQFPETWNSMKSVYNSFRDVGANCKILCVPKVENIDDIVYKMNKEGKNEAYEFMKENPDAINSYKSDGKWFNLEDLQPDYVFYTRPYNYHYPDCYKTNAVCKYSRICYIPYGYLLCEGIIFDSVYNNWFMSHSKYIFVNSNACWEILRKEYFIQDILGYNNLINIGYPRFDLLKNVEYNKENHRFTITWMPRWEFDKSVKGQKYSHFLEFYESFISYAKENKDINLIIRPHPLMFKTMINQKIKTEKEIEEIKSTINGIENISLDESKDYISTFNKTDLLIADTTSLLIEFFVTEKPIILTDTVDEYLKDGKMMASTLYKTLEWKEIENIINQIRLGNDKMIDERKKVLKKILPNSKEVGKSIVQFLLNEYDKERKDRNGR